MKPMPLASFLKTLAMLGLMAAPIIKLFEKPKRQYIVSASLDELVGLRFTAPKECTPIQGIHEWEIIQRIEDKWRNKFWIAPVNRSFPLLQVCFNDVDENGNINNLDKYWKFYRPK